MAERPKFETPLTQADFKQIVIPQVYLEHLTEFALRWEQRRELLQSSERTLADLEQADATLASHLEGLFRPGLGAVPTLVSQLEEGEPYIQFAAGFILLYLEDQQAANFVLEQFLAAEDEALDALTEALKHAPIRLIKNRLWEVLREAEPAVAVKAAEVLAFQKHLTEGHERIRQFYDDESPSVRSAAWRISSMLDSSGSRV